MMDKEEFLVLNDLTLKRVVKKVRFVRERRRERGARLYTRWRAEEHRQSLGSFHLFPASSACCPSKLFTSSLIITNQGRRNPTANTLSGKQGCVQVSGSADPSQTRLFSSLESQPPLF
jgi:hypothetical protein